MLLELAVGDAYGAGFEFTNPQHIVDNNKLAYYIKHPKHNLGLGKYTDDTQMSIAITEALLSPLPWTPQNLANSFVNVFKRDFRIGYARGFFSLLKEVKTGIELIERLKPDSEKSGSAMRAGPIGVISDAQRVLEYARIQAQITHNTENGIKAAQAAALMTHYFVYQLGNVGGLTKFLSSHISYNWDIEWTGEVGGRGIDCVHAAISAIITNTSLSEILKQCISYGGDTDTIATIAMAAASASIGIKQDLPEALTLNLENGQYGKDFLIDLDKRLMTKMRR